MNEVCYRCAVKDCFAAPHCREHCRTITHIPLHRLTIIATKGNLIEYHDLVATAHELISNVTAEEASPPRDEHSHRVYLRHQTATHPRHGTRDWRCRSRCFSRRVV